MATLNNTLSNYLFEGTNDADFLTNGTTYAGVITSVVGAGSTIYGYGGNDTIFNYPADVIIYGGDGNDDIRNSGGNVTINSGSGSNDITSHGDNVIINGGDYNNRISSAGNYVTINSGNGDDSYISNSGDNVIINSNSGNDHIFSQYGDNVTINAGEGDDYISFHMTNVSEVTSLNTVLYANGDGNDTIKGYNDTDKISITSSSGYSTVASGDDLLINIGEGSIRLVSVLSSGVEPVIIGTAATDTGSSSATDTTPSGEDTITPAVDTTPADVSSVYVDLSTISSGSGAFVIDGTSSTATFKSAAAENETVVGNVANQVYTAENILPQSIKNSNSNWTIGATSQNDNITNYASNVSINAGEGNNYIYNAAAKNYVTITAGSGNDMILNHGRFCVMYGGDGDDSIFSDILGDTYEDNTVYGGAGNDTLLVRDHKTFLDGGEGDDVVSVAGGYWETNTLQGGTGNDTLYGGGSNVFVYDEGDGDDLVKNYKTGDALKIGTTYESVVSGNDIILNIAGNGHITLEGAYSEDVVVNDETIHSGVHITTMNMSHWSYSFGSSTDLSTAADLFEDNLIASSSDSTGLSDVTLDQLIGTEVLGNAINLAGDTSSLLGQNSINYVASATAESSNPDSGISSLLQS